MVYMDSSRASMLVSGKAGHDGWSLELLQSLEWKRFEALSEALLKEIGLHTRCSDLAAGIDIEIYSRIEPARVAAIAQCKAWPDPVDEQRVSDFFAVMTAKGVKKGYLITSSSFTDNAKAYGKIDGITLIGGRRLLQLIGALSPEKSDKLLKLATQGDYTTPSCPGCGLKMLTRQAPDSDYQFWGCIRYPRCTETLEMKQAL